MSQIAQHRRSDPPAGRSWVTPRGVLALWAATAGFLSTLFVVGVPERYHELVNSCTESCDDRLLGVLDADQQGRLAEIGIDARLYAWWDIARESSLAIASLVLGTLLIRRVGTPIAFITATLMVAGGFVLVPEMSIAGERAGLLPDVVEIAAWVVSLVMIPVLLFLLPNGRFVPGWSWIPAVAVLIAWVSFAFVDRGEEPEAVHLGAAIGLLAFGIGAQVYRYRRASTPLERQQLKWLGVGMAGFFGSLVVYVVGDEVGVLDPAASGLEYPLGYVLYGILILAANGLFLFAWSMAILQHRLWDADGVLSRAVLAASATAGIVITYVVTVFVVAAVAGDHSDVAGPVAAAVLVVLVLAAREPVMRRITRLFYGQRDAPYELLSSLWSLANQNRPDADTLTLLAERLVESLHLRAGRVVITGDSGVIVDHTIGAPRDTPTKIPLEFGDDHVGELTAWPRFGETALSGRDVELITNASAPIAHLAATVRLTGDLRRSQANLISAREEERRRIHRNLHDDLGPTLAGQALLLDAAASTIDDDPAAAARFVGQARHRADDVVEHIRQMAHDLRPAALDQLGLAPSLRRAVSAAGNGGVRIDVDIGDLDGLPAATETAAYRIITEAFTNAVRHSDATTIHVRVHSRVDGGLDATVRDDGRGGTPTTRDGDGRGVGLRSMHQRARELGGHLRVTSRPDVGTTVDLMLPAAPDA